jgi:tetratricopeptide (TPR) repeat protein
MKRFVVHFSLSVLIYLILSIPPALAEEPSLKSLIEDARRHGLCGEYVADGGIYNKFVFGDGNKVVVDASGLVLDTTYFVIGDQVFVITDKDYLRLTVQSPSHLDGYGSWTKGYKYIRQNAPAQPCTLYAEDPAERSEVRNQLCYYSGVQLQAAMKFDQAAAKYLDCCNSGDAVSCNKYGTLKYLVWKDRDTAFKYYRKACDQGYGGACANLADVEKRKGNIQKARQLYEEACAKQFKGACYKAAMLEQSERDDESYFEQGYYYLRKNRNEKAVSEFSKAININPEYAAAYHYRGLAYQSMGQYDQAIADFSKVIELNPKDAGAHNSRANAWVNKGQYDLALSDFNKAVEMDPTDVLALNSFAWFLATCTESKYRDGKQAVKLAQKALGLEKNAAFFDTLAAAYAEDNSFDDAVKTQEMAIKLLEKDGATDELSEFKKHLDSYKTGKPWRE